MNLSDQQKTILILSYSGIISVIAQQSRQRNAALDDLWVRGQQAYSKANRLISSLDDKTIQAQLQYSWAILLLNRKENDKARELLQEVLELNPYHWRAYTALGQSMMSSGRNDEAILYLEKAVAIEPGYEFAYYQLGRAYRVSQVADKLEKAVNAFSKAPTISRAYIEKGRILAQENLDYEAAIDSFSKALELNSKLPEAYADLAWYLAELGNLSQADKSKALDAAARAVDLTARQDWHKLAVLGRVKYDFNSLDEAQAILFEAKNINDKAPQIYYYLALIEFSKGAYENCKKLLIEQFSLKDKSIWQEKAVELMRKVEAKLA